MNRFGLTEKDLQYIQEQLAQYPQIEQAKIFGSRAIGNQKIGSDIDIALFGNIDIQTLSKIKSLLEEKGPIPYFFDLVIYNQITNPDFKNHIDQFGIRI